MTMEGRRIGFLTAQSEVLSVTLLGGRSCERVCRRRRRRCRFVKRCPRVLLREAEESIGAGEEERFESTREGYVPPLSIITLLKSGEKDKALEAYYETKPKWKYSLSELSSLVAAFGKYHSDRAAEEVVHLFEAEEGNEVDLYVYNVLLKAFALRGNIPGLEKTFDRLLSTTNLRPNTISYGILVESYACRGKMAAAESAVRTMINSGAELDIHIFTSLLRGYAQKNNSDAVRRCFRRMRALQLKPDTVMYNVVLSLARKRKDTKAAESIFARMIAEKVSPDNATFTSMVQLYSEANNISRAKLAFDYIRLYGLEPDRFAYCAIIAAHCRQCDLPSAEFFLQEMTELGVTADTAVYNTILALRVKLDVEVESMLCQMEDRGVRQNHVTRAILSRSTRRLQVPSSVLMEAANEAPDSVVAITNAMRAFAAEGNVDEVLKCLRKAKTLSNVNASVYNIPIRMLIRSRRITTAETILVEMRSRSIPFDAVTYSLWMVILAKDVRTPPRAAYDLIKEMERNDIPPDSAIFNAMFGIRSIRPSEILKEMQARNIPTDTHTDRALIMSYVKRREITRALKLLRTLKTWDTRSVLLVCQGLRRIHMTKEAKALEIEATERGIDVNQWKK